jgi:phospholipase/lecithinase/hemolysin
MIGGNDAMDALKADVATPAAAVRPSAAIVSAAVDAIGTHLERLLAVGARRVLVANVPDLAVVPAIRVAARASGDEPPAQGAPPPNGAVPPPPPPVPLPPPSSLFVLGDSLSDVGNAAAAADYVLNVAIDPPTVGLCNPIEVLALHRRCDDLFHRQSRVSDGPVAVEHLAEHFGLATLRPSLHLLPNQPRNGTVYAVAGATARGVSDEGLARQVDWLLIDQAALPTDAIYVIMIGGNDAMDALKADVATPAAAVRPAPLDRSAREAHVSPGRTT